MAKKATKRITAGDALMHVYLTYEPDGSAYYETRRQVRPTLWLVQKGRKRASFTNAKAATTFAGKTGKIHKYVEVT